MQEREKSDLFYSSSTSIWLSWAQFILGIIIYVISYYLFNNSAGNWYNSEFESAVVAKLIVGILLLPIGLFGWYQPLSLFFTHVAFRFAGVLLICVAIIVPLFALGAIYFVEWQVSNWLAWDLSLTLPVRMVQGIFLSLTLWLIAVTLVCILVRAILHKPLFSDDARILSNGDQQPLLNVHSGLQQSTVIRRVDESSVILNDNFFEFAGIFLFFFVFIPIFIYLNCVLMSDWHRILPNYNDYHLSTGITTDAWTSYFAYDCLYNDGTSTTTITCYARLYYDVQIYFEFIFAVSLFSFIVSKFKTARVFVRKRILFPWANYNPLHTFPISMTIGEICFWILWLTMMFTIGYYFVAIHEFDDDDDKSALEKWARYVGILSMQLLSFGMFSITRIRLWNDCFQVSFEHLVSYHRFFGYCFVIFSYLHGLLWMLYFNNNDDGYTLALNMPFGDLPLDFHGTNWTIPVAYQYLIIFVPIFYIICTFFIIRRKFFELFYYTHLFAALVTISFIMWHATQAWRYIIPPLMLYAIDRMIRLYNSSLLCNVEQLQCLGVGNDVKITKLTFTVGDYSSDRKTAAFRNLAFKCGQYVFVSINNISLYEWHPYTISSGEYSSEVSIYAKNMGEKSKAWSNMLFKLANSDVGLKDIQLQIDGPYGKPFDYRDYKRVVLVAGGIGITPCHSIFDTILSRSIIGDSEIPYVELIWVVRKVSQVSMFLNTWQKYEENNDRNKFGIRIFVTRGPLEESSFQLVIPNTNIMYTQGRPPWNLILGTLLNNGDIDGNQSLVFACGPIGLVADVEQVAVGNGSHFYSESFEF